MKRYSWTFVLAFYVSIFQSHVSYSGQCQLTAAQISAGFLNFENGSRMASAMASATGGSGTMGYGLLFLITAYSQTRENGTSSLLQNPGVPTGSVLTSTAIGVFAWIWNQTSSGIELDSHRAFRRTLPYRCLTAELGPHRTEELMSDLYAGWTPDHLASKYLNRDENLLFQKIVAALH